MRLFPLVALALLAGCDSKPAPVVPEPLKTGAVAPDEGVRNFHYACDDGGKAEATYGINSAGQPNVILTVRGKTATLTAAAPAASGTRYTAENMLSPGRLAIWWDKAGQATLMEAVGGGIPTTLATCKVTAPPA